MPYSPELKFCPGCRAACSLDDPTCMVGESFKAQYLRDKAEEEKRKAAQENQDNQ